jgi:cytochrome c biogenesis protein CcdA
MQNRETRAFLTSIGLSLIAFFTLLLPNLAFASANNPQGIGPGGTGPTQPASENVKVEAYYFYSTTCSHCMDILQNIVQPLEAEHPGLLGIELVELGESVNYEALMKAESAFGIGAGDRGLPVVLIGDQMLNGEEQTREKFVALVEAGLEGDGIKLPEIPGVDPASLVISQAQPTPDAGLVCSPEDPSACEVSAPIYGAYFYQTGCKECARAETDMAYLKSKYPQLIIEEFNIFDEAAMAEWMALRVGVEKNFNTPALFIGDKAWIDEAEFTPASIEPILQELVADGSPAFWQDYNSEDGNSALIDRFEKMGWLAVVLAGLVDGLNPCAFATIIFFVSYLSLSGKKGKQILITGASFTLGVFIAYLLVGLGFYKVLDLISGWTSIISKIVYILTAVLCLVLAVLSIRDFIKVRQGDLNDMALKLPEPLRKRINQTVREGRKASSYIIGAFVTGLLISLLELACTGQIYLPVIISMSSIPSMRGQALLFLVLYNLMFIVPLIVVFILAFYGTTSKQFTEFLRKHAAAVKIGMAFVFLILAAWLIVSLLK